MKTLVTGGAGFIGSHLVDGLLTKGHEVVAIDNFVSGRPENLKARASDPRLQLIQADIRDVSAMEGCFEGVDWVFHLAALADIVPSIQKPMDYYSTNVTGTLNVLEAARAAGVKRFVYVASSSSYGIPDKVPTPETAEIRCEYPYALTKYLGELAVLHWHKVYHLPAVALKFFNIYGPRSRTSGTYGAVFGVFLAQKTNGKPYTVVGDGTQTRDFTYVTDAVSALILAAESEISGEVFNVGSGGSYSINHLVRLLGGDVAYVPKRPGEPDATYADISKIRRMLNWHPSVSFEEGVRRMLECSEDWKAAPVWEPDSVKAATREWFEYLGKAS
ncbi:MAG: SDR family oxidoreductase [Candidatus Omnitrophica bacterium]|nr:SDR family oxidoreductase [Candidatus Omnitrophota bacterium]